MLSLCADEALTAGVGAVVAPALVVLGGSVVATVPVDVADGVAAMLLDAGTVADAGAGAAAATAGPAAGFGATGAAAATAGLTADFGATGTAGEADACFSSPMVSIGALSPRSVASIPA